MELKHHSLELPSTTNFLDWLPARPSRNGKNVAASVPLFAAPSRCGTLAHTAKVEHVFNLTFSLAFSLFFNPEL